VIQADASTAPRWLDQPVNNADNSPSTPPATTNRARQIPS